MICDGFVIGFLLLSSASLGFISWSSFPFNGFWLNSDDGLYCEEIKSVQCDTRSGWQGKYDGILAVFYLLGIEYIKSAFILTWAEYSSPKEKSFLFLSSHNVSHTRRSHIYSILFLFFFENIFPMPSFQVVVRASSNIDLIFLNKNEKQIFRAQESIFSFFVNKLKVMQSNFQMWTNFKYRKRFGKSFL